MRIFCFITLCLISFTTVKAQDDEETYNRISQELGIDGYFSASNFGGTFALGLKYGFLFGEEQNWIAGPSFRLQRTWSNFLDQKFSYNILGLGTFIHARFYNALFLGAELEFIQTPLQYNTLQPPKKLIPVCFLGGGYSQQFNDFWRINAGIFYDVINDFDSPYRPFYTAKQENGVYIPILYRLAVFIPIGANKSADYPPQ